MSTPTVVHQVTDSEVHDKARALFEKMKVSTGSVPKWMRVMGNCEDILLGFFSLFNATMDDSPLDRVLKWKVGLVVSDINKCSFCVSIAKTQLKGLGLADEDMDKLDEKYTPRESLAIEYANASTLHAYKIEPEIVAKLKAEFSDEEIVELTSVVGLFNFINRFNDALGVLPD